MVSVYQTILIFFLCSKLKKINPGFDKVGKVGVDGNPLVSKARTSGTFKQPLNVVNSDIVSLCRQFLMLRGKAVTETDLIATRQTIPPLTMDWRSVSTVK